MLQVSEANYFHISNEIEMKFDIAPTAWHVDVQYNWSCVDVP